jgi:hypothetical protein
MKENNRDDIMNKYETLGDIYYSIKKAGSDDFETDMIKNYIFER